MSNIKILKERLTNKEKIVLAGACGTEIQRRGVRTELPLWSAGALLTHPEVVRSIHKDYILAGADIITTNTFRTNRRTLKKINKDEDAKKLTEIAVSLARKECTELSRNDVLIGGSIAPLEDCYEPSLVPSNEELFEEHLEHAQNLADCGVDFLFIETINTIREATAALEASRQVGLDAIVSFVCNGDGDLLSTETIEDALSSILSFSPLAVLTNCSPPKIAEVSLYKLLQSTELPVGIYANGEGHPHDELGWEFADNISAEKYFDYAKKWLQDGATIVGGCCGTTPEYIKKISQYIREKNC